MLMNFSFYISENSCFFFFLSWVRHGVTIDNAFINTSKFWTLSKTLHRLWNSLPVKSSGSLWPMPMGNPNKTGQCIRPYASTILIWTDGQTSWFRVKSSFQRSSALFRLLHGQFWRTLSIELWLMWFDCDFERKCFMIVYNYQSTENSSWNLIYLSGRALREKRLAQCCSTYSAHLLSFTCLTHTHRLSRIFHQPFIQYSVTAFYRAPL